MMHVMLLLSVIFRELFDQKIQKFDSNVLAVRSPSLRASDGLPGYDYELSGF